MRTLNFVYAACLLALGIAGLVSVKDPEQFRALTVPGLFFGGAVLFCSFFALKEPRHGMAGASFLAFLAFLTAGATVIGKLLRNAFDWNDPAQRIATAIFAISALYLAAAVTTWRKARRAKAMAELDLTDP